MQPGGLTVDEADARGGEELPRPAATSSEPERPASGSADGASRAPTRPRLQAPSWSRAGAPLWIWLGIAVVAVGFLLLALAWGSVAAEVQVHLQLPYVVSAGLVGLALIMVGLTALNVVTRQRDGADRDERIDRLIAIMEAIHEALAEQQAAEGRRQARPSRRTR